MWSLYYNLLRWSFRKNWPDIMGIVAKRYPRFVYSDTVTAIEDEIPIFVFHRVTPERFEHQLRYLKTNGYSTITGEELLQILKGRTSLSPRSVVLTFDDGSASLYSVAWPLLKKYGYKATAFIIPGLVPEEAPAAPTYEMYEKGQVTEEDLIAREAGDSPLCSWKEIELMHESGIIDFQAHSMYHHLVLVSPLLVDFLHPGYDYYYFGNIHVPVYWHRGQPNYSRQEPWGTPVYLYEPRMSRRRQYFDDEDLRNACARFVEDAGGKEFFNYPKWRRELTKFFNERRKTLRNGRFESAAEQFQAVLSDFIACKKAIERRLKGKTVTQYCFPWFIGSRLAVNAASQSGFEALFWGVRYDKRVNHLKGDPKRLVRLEDRFIYRLPGVGRLPLSTIIRNKVLENFPRFRGRLKAKPSS